MFTTLINWFEGLFNKGRTVISPEPLNRSLSPESSAFLTEQVEFYRALNKTDRLLFEQRALLFIDTTDIVGQGVEVTKEVAPSGWTQILNFKKNNLC
jgi:hypothetical protein